MQQSEKMSATEENSQGVMPVIGIVTDPNEEFLTDWTRPVTTTRSLLAKNPTPPGAATDRIVR
jgi:hypothetical protein